jgi:hypothetical protein
MPCFSSVFLSLLILPPIQSWLLGGPTVLSQPWTLTIHHYCHSAKILKERMQWVISIKSRVGNLTPKLICWWHLEVEPLESN